MSKNLADRNRVRGAAFIVIRKTTKGLTDEEAMKRAEMVVDECFGFSG